MTSVLVNSSFEGFWEDPAVCLTGVIVHKQNITRNTFLSSSQPIKHRYIHIFTVHYYFICSFCAHQIITMYICHILRIIIFVCVFKVIQCIFIYMYIHFLGDIPNPTTAES